MLATLLSKFRKWYFSLCGMHFHPQSVVCPVPIRPFYVVGSYKNIYLDKNAEVRSGCVLIARDKIIIGENSTLAYCTKILTSADPNGPYNALSKLYPYKKAPVTIGKNVWVGANSTILPGVTIGDFVVVAAGSVVTRDVPSGCMVAGVPAVIKKKLPVS